MQILGHKFGNDGVGIHLSPPQSGYMLIKRHWENTGLLDFVQRLAEEIPAL